MKSLFLTFKEPVSGSFLLIQHAKQDAKKSLALSDIYILQGKNIQLKKREINIPIFLAQDKCANPDLSTADINEKFYEEPLMRSKIIHNCGSQRVFNDTYKQEKTQCCLPYQGKVMWKYNTTNRLPACIRRFPAVFISIFSVILSILFGGTAQQAIIRLQISNQVQAHHWSSCVLHMYNWV